MAKSGSKPAAASEVDRDLLATLVKGAKGFRDRVPVFQIVQPSAEKSVTQARTLLAAIWPQFGDCSPFLNVTNGTFTQLRLPNEGHTDVFHPSGAIAASMRPKSVQRPIGTDERKVDRKSLLKSAKEIAGIIAKPHVNSNEELRFESTWELKAKGQTISNAKKKAVETTPTALFEVLAAFRRYLYGLPVLGRATVHVALGAGEMVTRWGIDWRSVRQEPSTQTSVLDPQEGAKRVLDDLWWRRPERPFTLNDFEPKSFELGYFSLSRRREQFLMQPAWIAVLAPRASMTMGHVVVVPAAPRAFEPITRSQGSPPSVRS